MSLPLWVWCLCFLGCGFAAAAARSDRHVWAVLSALFTFAGAFAALMLNAPWSEVLSLPLLPLIVCVFLRRREADG